MFTFFKGLFGWVWVIGGDEDIVFEDRRRTFELLNV